MIVEEPNLSDAQTLDKPQASTKLGTDNTATESKAHPEKTHSEALKRGRPPVARERREVLKKLSHGSASIDKVWLLKQLLDIYSNKGFRAQDRLRAIELMARLSGYTGKDAVTEEDEAKAISELMKDMESNSDASGPNCKAFG